MQLSVDAAHAPRPLVVDHRLVAEDQLVLVNRIHVGIDFATQVTDRPVTLRMSPGRLRRRDRPLVDHAVVVEILQTLERVEETLVDEARPPA